MQQSCRTDLFWENFRRSKTPKLPKVPRSQVLNLGTHRPGDWVSWAGLSPKFEKSTNIVRVGSQVEKSTYNRYLYTYVAFWGILAGTQTSETGLGRLERLKLFFPTCFHVITPRQYKSCILPAFNVRTAKLRAQVTLNRIRWLQQSDLKSGIQRSSLDRDFDWYPCSLHRC